MPFRQIVKLRMALFQTFGWRAGSGWVVVQAGNECGQPCDEVFRCKHKVRGAIPESWVLRKRAFITIFRPNKTWR